MSPRVSIATRKDVDGCYRVAWTHAADAQVYYARSAREALAIATTMRATWSSTVEALKEVTQ